MCVRLVVALLIGLAASVACASDPLPQPGDSGSGFGVQPGGSSILGGRPGRTRPIVPSPRTNSRPPPLISPQAPKRGQPAEELPLGPMSLDVPIAPSDDGPPDGLTLDAAVDLLNRSSLTLKARQLDIPQARADELTASLRANPFVYGGAQLLPYKRYSLQSNPGGPAQYDINVTYPVDLSRKREARIASAFQARRTVEAQFQDAVRQEVDSLYTAYVDVLAARETLRFSQASLAAIDQAVASQGKTDDKSDEAQLQRDHVDVHRDSVELGILDAQANLQQSRRALATLLNIPREYADRVELRGSLRDAQNNVAETDDLIAMALVARPDLNAYRMSLCRAMADVRLAKANRLSDIYVLYEPYTYQDNGPFGFPGAKSWAVGATVPLPVYDRNQGNIRKASFNVEQSKLEVEAVERRVAAEVDDARAEYVISRELVTRIERHLLPAARRVRDDSLKLSEKAGGDIYAYLIAQRDYQDLVRQYRDALVRHRRSMLKLNSVVGMRILP
jgi:cobalt-zinc-cadmium efflux system outer membrane protein